MPKPNIFGSMRGGRALMRDCRSFKDESGNDEMNFLHECLICLMCRFGRVRVGNDWKLLSDNANAMFDRVVGGKR